MKILSLLRHAKAVEPGRGVDDHERQLSDRGRRSALAVGHHSPIPELVLCSSARRTRETLDGLATAWGALPQVRYERSLYLASPSTLMQQIHRVEDSVASLWLIGHNPGLHELSLALASGGRGLNRFPALADRFPTAARAVFALDAQSWAELGTGPVTLTGFELVD